MSTSRSRSPARRRKSIALAQRRQPVQARAQKSVEVILNTAVRILEEAGLEAFNTNVLAERAGIRVRTVYRYFPNKLAVITAVAERMAAEWNGWFDGFRDLADPGTDWRGLWTAYIDTFVAGILRAPGGLAIRRAMRALPELQAIDRRDNERLACQLARALELRGTGLPRTRLRIMSRMLVETAGTVLDLALLEPEVNATRLVAELKRMHLAYLEAAIKEHVALRRPQRVPDRRVARGLPRS